MPWQVQVNAVANEVMPDGTFRYPTVILSTPRQAGKTTLLNAVLAHRAMTMPDFRAFYTAQTGLHARDVWTEWATTLELRMPKRWRFRRSAGMETATWPGTGGFIRAFPPTPDSLHSKQSDFVGLDEVWSYTLADGSAITQAVVPTQATRPRRQLWIVSTAGDENSVWMRSWIERGRASIDDPDSRICYIEYSAPDDAPWDDPQTWATYHPAFGHTQDISAMRDAMEQFGESGFRRGYLNQWPTTETSWQTAWPTLDTETRIPVTAPITLAADSAWSHRAASIAAAAVLDDGRVAIEVIDHQSGMDWLIPRLRDLTKRHRTAVVIHKSGPLGYLIEDMKRAGIRLIEAPETAYADAIATFQTMVTGGLICHPADPRLDLAVANVVASSTDRPVWKRRQSTVDISPLTAAAFAARRASTRPARPVFRS